MCEAEGKGMTALFCSVLLLVVLVVMSVDWKRR